MNKKIIFSDNATPIDDYSGLKQNWINTLDQLNLVEGKNINDAYQKYFFT